MKLCHILEKNNCETLAQINLNTILFGNPFTVKHLKQKYYLNSKQLDFYTPKKQSTTQQWTAHFMYDFLIFFN